MTSGAPRSGLWRGVFWAAVIVLAAALIVAGVIVYGYWAGQNVYDRLEEVAFADAGDKEALAVDWDALRAVNPDVCGWIIVPGTNIDYPIAHRDGDDDYYLSHNFNGEESGAGPDIGCILLAGANNPDWSDEVNLCYGHNLLSGTMFSAFNTLRDDESFNAHRTIYLLTPEANWELETFAMDRIEGTDTTIAVQNFATKAELEAYIQARIDASIVTADPPGPQPSAIAKVFAFSTCNPEDNHWRTITFAAIRQTLTEAPGKADESVGSYPLRAA